MGCARCGADNADSAGFCSACGLALKAAPPPPRALEDGEDDLETIAFPRGDEVATPAPSSASSPPRTSASASQAQRGPQVLPEGTEIGQRYRLVRMLGRGGMGAVYLAKDTELDRDVALKFIRDDIAESPETLQRFKREITLSSQITNKNVLRVYDLGEADGVKFVTMQYVEGEDLAGKIRREGALPAPETISILQQICHGLAAAHEQGVVHRDLKPQNIMLDTAGGVYVTDFGLAKLLGQTGVTETGALMGTPFYMSPEQVKGIEVDRRSDIYSLGVIAYEMGTGSPPFAEGSAFEIMMKRTQKPPRPLAELKPDLPAYLRALIERCLAVEPSQRYQSCEEILADLGSESVARVPWRVPRLPGREPLLIAGALILALSLAGAFAWRLRSAPSAAHNAAPQSVLVADFANRTGDPVLDGTVESVFGLALEEASFLNPYSRVSARRLAAQLQPGAKELGEAVARLVAVREGVNTVTSGAIESAGKGYRISARVVDPITGQVLLETTAGASSKDDVLRAANRLAARVRNALGDTTPESVQLAKGETFTAGSVEAAHEYALGQDLLASGKWDEAGEHYRKAIALDPNLGRAYAGLAAVNANLGRRQEADRWFSEAMARLSRMSEREKFRTRGLYFLVVREPDKAIEQFEQLLKQFPADTAGSANLALAWFYARNMEKALAVGRKAIELSPKNVPQRNNVALYAMYAGDFPGAVQEFRKVLELNSRFPVALVGLALSQLAQGQKDAAADTYRRLAAVDSHGASAASMGLADLALYQGKTREAVAELEKGLALDESLKDRDAAARKRVTLAGTLLAAGRAREARAAVERAVTEGHGENVLYPAALVYLGLGNENRAMALADELGGRLETEPQAYGLLVRGEVLLKRHDPRGAVKAFEMARVVADTWLGRVALGRAYLAAGAFMEAHTELETAAKRRGEATAAFLDEVPTYRLFPPVYFDLGRANLGLKDPAAADSLKTFLALRESADGDPLVAEARRLLARP
jgi:tetratricopeptide (TPR) repeat protein